MWHVALFASFVGTYLLTPVVAKRLEEARITGNDMNKKSRPELPSLGGLSISAGFVFAMLINVAAHKNIQLLAAMTTILVVTLVGLVDDLLHTSQRTKALLPVLAAAPLVAVNAGKASMTLPFLGSVELGVLYPLIVLPLGITGASNAVNMLAGLNGLEAGLGAVMHATVLFTALSIMGVHPEAYWAALISASMLGALLAFLKYNWHPAKVFIGDVGTLPIGCALAAAVVLGDMEKLGIILIVPYLFEFLLKARTGFKGESFGFQRKNGTLGTKEVNSLTHVVMKAGKFTEPQVVAVLLGIEAVFGLLALLTFGA